LTVRELTVSKVDEPLRGFMTPEERCGIARSAGMIGGLRWNKTLLALTAVVSTHYWTSEAASTSELLVVA